MIDRILSKIDQDLPSVQKIVGGSANHTNGRKPASGRPLTPDQVEKARVALREVADDPLITESSKRRRAAESDDSVDKK